MARILVVERDAKIRELLSRFLGVKGHEVTTAADGDAGMQAFLAERPDLMLVDVQLSGTDGLALCRAVRETHLEVRLVLMGTARQSRRPAVEAAREALDMPLFLVKPFGIGALMAAVDPEDRAGPAGPPAREPDGSSGSSAPNASASEPSGSSLGGDDPVSDPVNSAGSMSSVEPPLAEIDAEVDAALDADAPSPFEVDDPTTVAPVPLLDPPAPAAPSEPTPPDPPHRAETGGLGGLLAGDSMEIVSASVAYDAPRSEALEAVYPVAGRGARDTWGIESLRMDAIRHGPVQLDEGEQRYALEPMVPEGPTDPRGIYGAVTLPQLLYRCFSDLFTGRLLIRRGAVRKEILLANGRPIGADSNIRSESLGYLLLRDGVIDQAQLRQSVRLARQAGIKQGEALVSIGAITMEALPGHLRAQVRGRILSCFAWSGAEYGLVYEPDVRSRGGVLELNPLVLIFDGIKTSFPVAPLVHHFDAHNRSPVRATERLRDYATMLRDFADELQLAMLCDGQRTLGEVLAGSRYGLIDTLRILRALEITGCLVLGEARAPDASLVGETRRSPRETVGTSMNISRSERRTTISSPPVDSLVELEGDSMTSDVEAPRRTARRRRSRRLETGPDLIKAETNFSKGKRALDADELDEAIAHFDLACRQDPHEPLFRMYGAWARYRSGGDRKARAAAIEALKEAVKAAPHSDEGEVLLGHVYRDQGSRESAVKHYRRALTLNRRNPHANRALRELEGQRTLEERDPGGLFGKFFTRR